MNILKLFLLILCVAVPSAVLFYNKAALACEMAPFIGFEAVQAELYVDASLSNAQRENLIAQVHQAKNRVDAAFGKMQSSPRYIVSKNHAYQQVGFNSTGMARSALLRECVFIGPKGMNVDVIAHETAHAEVFHRASFFTKNFKIKPWLLEGSGTYVDYRAPLLLENINIERAQVSRVMGLSDFSPKDTWAYQASRVAFERIDPKTLYKGIERLNSGESFDTVFGKQH